MIRPGDELVLVDDEEVKLNPTPDELVRLLTTRRLVHFFK
jgi:hypothetical protein